jgi:hypothetical protein
MGGEQKHPFFPRHPYLRRWSFGAHCLAIVH